MNDNKPAATDAVTLAALELNDLRDTIAIEAMKKIMLAGGAAIGTIAADEKGLTNGQMIARRSYCMADYMLEARKTSEVQNVGSN